MKIDPKNIKSLGALKNFLLAKGNLSEKSEESEKIAFGDIEEGKIDEFLTVCTLLEERRMRQSLVFLRESPAVKNLLNNPSMKDVYIKTWDDISTLHKSIYTYFVTDKNTADTLFKSLWDDNTQVKKLKDTLKTWSDLFHLYDRLPPSIRYDLFISLWNDSPTVQKSLQSNITTWDDLIALHVKMTLDLPPNIVDELFTPLWNYCPAVQSLKQNLKGYEEYLKKNFNLSKLHILISTLQLGRKAGFQKNIDVILNHWTKDNKEALFQKATGFWRAINFGSSDNVTPDVELISEIITSSLFKEFFIYLKTNKYSSLNLTKEEMSYLFKKNGSQILSMLFFGCVLHRGYPLTVSDDQTKVEGFTLLMATYGEHIKDITFKNIDELFLLIAEEPNNRTTTERRKSFLALLNFHLDYKKKSSEGITFEDIQYWNDIYIKIRNSPKEIIYFNEGKGEKHSDEFKQWRENIRNLLKNWLISSLDILTKTQSSMKIDGHDVKTKEEEILEKTITLPIFLEKTAKELVQEKVSNFFPLWQKTSTVASGTQLTSQGEELKKRLETLRIPQNTTSSIRMKSRNIQQDL